MHKALISELEDLFKTRFVLKLNKETQYPADVNVEEFKDFFSFDSNGVRRGIFIKEKILSSREKALLTMIVKKHFDSESSYKDLLVNKFAYREFSSPLRFPFQIWEFKTGKENEEIFEVIDTIFPNDIKFFKDRETIILFKEIDEEAEEKISPTEVFYDIESEILAESQIFISYPIKSSQDIYQAHFDLGILKDVSLSLRSNTKVYEYDDYMLPSMIYLMKSSEDFMQMTETFKKNNCINLDNELLETAIIFLENNLNITEAANRLYIHRNTLIYRLNKIVSMTGYDIRKFSDALNFYLSYLIKEIIINN